MKNFEEFKAKGKSYLVILTYDLNDASSTEHRIVKQILAEKGFITQIKSNKGNMVDLPNNTFSLSMKSEKAKKELRTYLNNMVMEAFEFADVKAKYFIHVGVDLAWIIGTHENEQ